MSMYTRRLALVALRPAAARFAQGVISCRSQSTLITQFEASVASLPQREAVRYTAKNLKWTATEVKHFVDAHANALLEHGFVKGEVLALWLPDSAEKHVTLLAAAKIGLKVVDVDQSLATVADMRKILSTSACKAIFFEPVSKTQDNLLLLRKAIPEFFYCESLPRNFCIIDCLPNSLTSNPHPTPTQTTTSTARTFTRSTSPASSISCTLALTSRWAA